MAKIVFVLGGLFSGIGKGIVASSIAKLFKLNKLKVSIQKHDPYLNIDCHMMNPGEHGEVFVTQDGLETDLDLGNYERFLNQNLTSLSSVTSGQIFQSVLNRERNGKYFGKTVNIYDISEVIQERILEILAKEESDCLVIELGGTIGDNDLTPFLIAAAQTQRKLGFDKVAFVFLTYVSYFESLDSFKTKPTQNSIAALRANGIEPNFVILRSDRILTDEIKTKVAKFCYLNDNQIFVLSNTNIYLIPSILFNQGLFEEILNFFSFPKQLDTTQLQFLPQKITNLKKSSQKIKIAIINKYPNFKQTYLSFYEAMYAASLNTNIIFEYEEINPEMINLKNVNKILGSFNAIVVPGGFGSRGTAGMLLSIQFARENKVPFFGVCFGLQLALIEFARNALKITNATSEEFTDDVSKPLIIHYFDQKNCEMLIGEKKIKLLNNTLALKFYQQEIILGRHRHRLVFNKKYQDQFQQKGVVFSAFSLDQENTVEIIELSNHPFFLATQFHIEWISYPEKPNPVFVAFFKITFQEKN